MFLLHDYDVQLLTLIAFKSAGGHLSLLTAYHILRSHPSFDCARLGLLLHFGAFDLSLLPQGRNFPLPLVLNRKAMENFFSAFIPNIFPPSNSPSKSSLDDLKDPKISPYYEDLEKWRTKLPVALFTCGSMDCLVDDSVTMAAKWAMSGGEQILRIVEGGCHGYIAFDPKLYPVSQIGRDICADFIKDVMSRG